MLQHQTSHSNVVPINSQSPIPQQSYRPTKQVAPTTKAKLRWHKVTFELVLLMCLGLGGIAVVFLVLAVTRKS